MRCVKERERLERRSAMDRKKICNSRLLCRGKGRKDARLTSAKDCDKDWILSGKISKRLGRRYANAEVSRQQQKEAAEEQGVKLDDEGCPRKGWMGSMRPAAWVYNQCS
jgi:hypothetical protein